MKSQSLSIDFILGFFVLLFVFALFFSLWNSYESKRQDTMYSNELYSFSVSSLRFLLDSSGYPLNWSSNISTVQSIGISDGNNGISYDKLTAFSALNSSMYNQSVYLLGVSPHDYYFRLSSFNGSEYVAVVAVGMAPSEHAVASVSTREVFFNNTWSRAEMFVWDEK